MIFSRKRDTAQPKSRTVGQIVDDEFGIVRYKRTNSQYVRVRVNDNGDVTATLPRRAPLAYVTQLLDSSRASIRDLVNSQRKQPVRYQDGMRLGHSHTLHLTYDDTVTSGKKRVINQELHLTIPKQWEDSATGRDYISTHVKQVLRREAEAYLPRRLQYFADTYGFVFEKIRYGNPKGRWGSCSSSGTISLNVALMNTPHAVIDYVLLHELAHTKHMNHSPEFWAVVAECMPDYKVHRKTLKTMSPIC